MTLLEKATLSVALYCCWELASIVIAKTNGGEPVAALSLYHALVYNPRVRGEQS